MRGIVKVYVDDLAGALADLGVAAARLRMGMAASYPGPCLSHLSEAQFRRGDWDAAVTYAQLATALAQDTDRPLDLARAHGRYAQVLALRGQWAVAEAHLGAVGPRSGASPWSSRLPPPPSPGLRSLRPGTTGSACCWATEAVRAAGPIEVGGRPGIFNWRAMAADALIRLGRLDEADVGLHEFEAAIPGAGWRRPIWLYARCRANLAVGAGDTNEADEEFTQAHVLEAHVPMPFERALVSLDDGRRLRSGGKARDAVA